MLLKTRVGDDVVIKNDLIVLSQLMSFEVPLDNLEKLPFYDAHSVIRTNENLIQTYNDFKEVFALFVLEYEVCKNDLLASTINLAVAKSEVANLSNSIDTMVDILKPVSYDEALDEATDDFMQSFSGLGPVSFGMNGELVVDDKTTLTKDDFKQMMRNAVQAWVRAKKEGK